MKTLKSILFSAIAATTLATSASAGPYGDCVSATWDPIGCWLNPDHETWGGMSIAAPGVGNPGKEDIQRIKKMTDAGVFKKLEESVGKPGKKVTRVCEMSKVLDIIEDTNSVDKAAEACYKASK